MRRPVVGTEKPLAVEVDEVAGRVGGRDFGFPRYAVRRDRRSALFAGVIVGRPGGRAGEERPVNFGSEADAARRAAVVLEGHADLAGLLLLPFAVVPVEVGELGLLIGGQEGGFLQLLAAVE